MEDNLKTDEPKNRIALSMKQYLLHLIKKEKKMTQITSIWSETKDISTDSSDIRMIIWEH
jgi:hypothetical protein